jgi:hypothetical protein
LKRVLILILAIGLMVALLTVTGCGDGDTATTTDTSDSEVTETEDRETTEETEEAAFKSADELPIYPGAEYDRGELETEGEPGVTSTSGIMYKSSDSYEEVVEWYKDILGEPTVEDKGEYPRTAWENITKRSQGDDTPEISLSVHKDEDGAIIDIDQTYW